MKLYGHADENRPSVTLDPSELAEITLVANPDELRRIAKFLESCASGMEERGKTWEHEHLSDRDASFEDSPHFVVYNPDAV